MGKFEEFSVALSDFLQAHQLAWSPDLRRTWEAANREVQTLRGLVARKNIEMSLVEQLLEDPNFDTTSMDMEYWNSIHDKLKEKLGGE